MQQHSGKAEAGPASFTYYHRAVVCLFRLQTDFLERCFPSIIAVLIEVPA